MTVQQLIDELMKIADKTKEVRTQGCDCYGDACSVDEDETTVFIERS